MASRRRPWRASCGAPAPARRGGRAIDGGRPPPQDAERLRAYLDVPDRYSLPLVVSTGYAPADAAPGAPSPRLPPADVFFGDRFGAALGLPAE